MSLTPKQIRFVEQYLVTENGTQAAINAGYGKSSAHVTAHRLLKNDKVRQEIEVKRQVLTIRYTDIKDKLIEELSEVAFSDMRDFASWNEGKITLFASDVLNKKSKVIQTLRETHNQYGSSVQIRMHDKLKAIELLMRHLGMLSDDASKDQKLEINVNYKKPEKND